jgi:hypothetical protein
MRTLYELENEMTPRASRWFAGLFLLGWLVWMAGDWTLRFQWYEWGTGLISAPGASVMSSEPPSVDAGLPLFTTNHVSASRGGDLSRLLGVRSLASRFEEFREAGVNVRDRDGYINRPYDVGSVPDVVVVGDSFMATGLMKDMFATRLADVSGLQVYNHALMGHGPFVSVLKFIDNPRFHDRYPRVLIWGFAEREIGGDMFAGLVYQLAIRANTGLQEDRAATEEGGMPATGVRVHWNELSPRLLKTSLPNSSMTAQAGAWLWNRVRYYLFGMINPEVVVSLPNESGEQSLFFRYHIETLRWSERVRDVSKVAWSIQYLHDWCSARDIHLIVLLIPEKEQVLQAWIPQAIKEQGPPIAPSPLPALEKALQERSIHVVNMLPVFEEAISENKTVYWRDDTHWNPRGLRMAVDRVWTELQPLLE